MEFGKNFEHEEGKNRLLIRRLALGVHRPVLGGRKPVWGLHILGSRILGHRTLVWGG